MSSNLLGDSGGHLVKFIGDPMVWRLADEKLYLNLDAGIQEEWLKDIPGRIRKADANWKTIRDKSPSEL